MTLPWYSIFLCGFVGSCAVEVVTLYHAVSADATDSFVLPSRYKSPVFWVIRLALALVAGGLAVAYEIDKPLLAINIGAATPLILQSLSQGLKNSLPSPNGK